MMTQAPELTDHTPLSERLLAQCVGQPATISWPHRILHEAAAVVRAAEDVVAGRGMFGSDPRADLDWAVSHIAETLDHRRASAAPADDALRVAAQRYLAVRAKGPDLDCWDSETGEEEKGAERFASDWSWNDYHHACDLARDALRAALEDRT